MAKNTHAGSAPARVRGDEKRASYAKGSGGQEQQEVSEDEAGDGAQRGRSEGAEDQRIAAAALGGAHGLGGPTLARLRRGLTSGQRDQGCSQLKGAGFLFAGLDPVHGGLVGARCRGYACLGPVGGHKGKNRGLRGHRELSYTRSHCCAIRSRL